MQPLSNTGDGDSLCDLPPGINQNTNHQIQARKDMAFVNEYATDEDIEKYDLNRIWDQYHPARKGKYYLGQRPWFTIDREKNILVMMVGGGGREDAGRVKILLLIKGCHVVVELESANGSSLSFKDNPFKIVWDLISVHSQQDLNVPQKEVLKILKEALSVYGYFGVHEQIPNTIVEFNF